jgi:hypothetical protein
VKLKGFRLFGGADPATAALRKVLAWRGLEAPHTGKPLGDALLLGVGGGIDAAWVEDEHGIAIGTRRHWREDVAYVKTICRRLGVLPTVKESDDPVTALRQLEETLGSGKAAVCWVAAERLPHWGGSAHGDWAIVVFGHDVDADEAWVSDLSRKGILLGAEELAHARAGAGAGRNTMLSAAPPNAVRGLEQGVRDGIRDAVGALLDGDGATTGLDALAAAARRIADFTTSDGWWKRYPRGRALLHALASVYRSVSHFGNGGDALRGTFADFLDEASALPGLERVRDVAAAYRDAAELWVAFAAAALPDGAGPLAEQRRLLERREEAIFEQKPDVVDAVAKRCPKEQLHSARVQAKFPLDARATRKLLGALAHRLDAVVAHERACAAALRSAID